MRQNRHVRRWVGAAAMFWLVASCATAAAQDARGAETGLPIPRFVSIKAAEANVRRGPSLSHRVDWVFRHSGLPVIVTGEYGHWRRIVDRDGMGGWVHYAMLSGSRTVIVDADLAPMRRAPDAASPVRAQAEAGVIARLEDCTEGWCRIRADGRTGWIQAEALWGVELPGSTPVQAAAAPE